MEPKRYLSKGVLVWLVVGGALVFAHDGVHGVGESKVDWDRQVATLNARLEKAPKDSIALSRLGSLYLTRARASGKHADFDQAIDAFRRVIAVLPENGPAWRGLAYAHLGRHDFSEAMAAARATSELEPDSKATLAMMADIHIALGHRLEASLLAEAMLAGEENVAGLTRAAQAAEMRGDLVRAETLFRQARDRSDSDGERAWLDTMLAEIYWQIGELDSAKVHFEKSLEHANTASYAHWRLAVMARFAGDTQAALHHVQHAISLTPDRPAIVFERGRVASMLGDKATAERCFQRAITTIEAEIVNGDEGHLRELAAFLAAADRNLSRALNLALRDLKKRQDWQSRELVAWLYYRNDRVDEAVSHVRTALRTGVTHPRLLLRAGIIFEAAGLHFHAYHAFRKGLAVTDAVEPTLRQRAERQFNAIQNDPARIRGLLGVQTDSVSEND